MATWRLPIRKISFREKDSRLRSVAPFAPGRQEIEQHDPRVCGACGFEVDPRMREPLALEDLRDGG